jgi:predicted RNA-binding protein Jag
MKQFKARTLEEAYEKATSALDCSITKLDIKIIQQ